MLPPKNKINPRGLIFSVSNRGVVYLIAYIDKNTLSGI